MRNFWALVILTVLLLTRLIQTLMIYTEDLRVIVLTDILEIFTVPQTDMV